MGLNSGKRIEADSKRKFVTIVVPPVPMSCGVDVVQEGGATFHTLAPVDGRINELLVYVGDIVSPAKAVDIMIKRVDSQGTMGYGFKVPKGSKALKDLNIDVKKGDRLDIDITTPSSIIIMTFNIDPTITDVMKKNYVMEDIDNAGV